MQINNSLISAIYFGSFFELVNLLHATMTVAADEPSEHS
jgi:hypothetical protein